MFFNNPKAIILVSRQKVTITIPPQVIKEIEIPISIVLYEEVIDTQNLQKLIADFLQEQQLKPQKALVLLADDLVYQKQIQLSERAQEKELFADFLAEIPFELPNLFCLRSQDSNGISYYCSPVDLVARIQNAFAGWKIMAILPQAVVGDTPATQILSQYKKFQKNLYPLNT
jgi:hypothetical protein